MFPETPTRHMMDRMVPMVKVAAESSWAVSFRGGSVALAPLSTRTPTGSMDTVVISGCVGIEMKGLRVETV